MHKHNTTITAAPRSPPFIRISPSTGHGAFLNADDAATVAAFTERLMPGAPGKPGALDAGVLNYIDLALAGFYADHAGLLPARAQLARSLLPEDLQGVVRERSAPSARTR